MHHPTARLVISHLVGGDAFAVQAVALVQSARLFEDDAAVPAPIRQQVLETCLKLPPDQAPAYAHPANQQPVPANEAGLSAQIVPIISSLPVDPALAIGHLWALTQLWPHVAADERPLLRARLINGLAAQRINQSALLSPIQLRQYQRQVPTQFGEQRPSVAALRGMLDAKEPLAAYCQLAEHLGMTNELETLCWVLGSLNVQQMQSYHDRHGLLAQTLFGTTACERLAKHIPIDFLLKLISQIAHRMWWTRNRGGLQPVITSLDQIQPPFRVAVNTGDITLAQRAARKLSAQQPAKFWDECWLLVRDLCLQNGADLCPVLTVLDATRWRAGDGIPSGDDAAAVATMFADCTWHHRPPRKATS
ncbi:MAG: hypothetical protein AAB263_00330 [Planctomycetota bacterium]